MRRLRLFLVFIVFIAISLPRASVAGQQVAAGQLLTGGETTETNRAPIIPFLEGTDVFWTLVKKDARDDGAVFFPNKLEANIFPHLVLYQNFTDILDIDDQFEKSTEADERKDVKEMAMVFSGTPAVRIRMLQDRSAPVRTPSYMPRGNFQFLWVRGIKPRSDSGKRERPRGLSEFIQKLRDVRQIGIWELHVIGGHHSNGQDGCLSTDQALDPPPPAETGECIPAGLVPTRETINRRDGSFASQFFFRFGGNYSRNLMRRGTPVNASEPPQAFREWRLSAEYEWHPKKLVDDQMRDIYGRHRANLGAAYATRGVQWCKRRFEVAGGVVWNPGVVDPELDWSGHVTATCFPWLNGGWGFLVRWYTGQDYYNVGFLDDINRLQVGVTFNQADFFRFRRRPAKTNN
jgi:hypothetical protein